MRLLNSATLELEDFFDDRIPEYAILSHRWLDGEVSLKHMADGTATKMPGYAKLKLCCDQAMKDGLKYVWVDTCCIDKASSAELNEAINSMYRWYRNAVVCYAYMADVQTSDVSVDAGFGKSVWFTRGWTLQELIAPIRVEFYNGAWQKLGTKESLKDAISRITSIDVALLEGVDPEEFSIAKRMSWASKRTTTRAEDRAYSLLGLFGVNMPMLYGEGGDRAFIRLQEEIMKRSDDQSLFAWRSIRDGYHGLLAMSPSDFEQCYNIVASRSKWNRIPYSFTNMGLSIEMPMVAWAMDTYLAALDCELENTPDSRIGIFLQLLPESDQYTRVLLDGKDIRTFEKELVSEVKYRQIYVRQRAYRSRLPLDRLYGFWIRTLPTKITTAPGQDDGRSTVKSWNQWSDEDRILKIPTGSRGTAGSIWYNLGPGSHPLKLGFDSDFNPVCQFDGFLYSPVKPGIDQTSDAAEMDPSWMMVPRSDFLHKGDRLTGYYKEGPRYRISMTDETIGNQRMWVLDILDLIKKQEEGSEQDGPRHDCICDGCDRYIYGKRFRCRVCPDFDYCSKCILTSGETHGPHEFQLIESSSG